MYPDSDSKSAALFRRATAVMPAGNSRHTVAMIPYPLYAVRGNGCRVTDADGVTRLDFINNYSSLIHGHGHPAVRDAVTKQLVNLTAVGLPTESEIVLAELLCERYPAVERVRFTNSGTEAVMLAIKAARALTGRSKIAKVEGTYHGTYDYAQISQAPSPRDWGPSDSPNSVVHCPGTPRSVAADTVVLPFNGPEAAAAILQRHESELAAVLLDVMPSHLSYTQVSPAFLQVLRQFQATSRTLLILDEVYSLRLHFQGAHTKYRVRPDLIAMGKIIGGGFPVGALGGSPESMSVFEPSAGSRFVPHGGTYNANPITMTAGTASLTSYDDAAVDRLNRLGDLARKGVQEAIQLAGTEAHVIGDGSLFAIRLSKDRSRGYRELVASEKEKERVAAVHRRLLNEGILAAPQLLFVLSTAMQPQDIDRLCEACLATFRAAL